MVMENRFGEVSELWPPFFCCDVIGEGANDQGEKGEDDFIERDSTLGFCPFWFLFRNNKPWIKPGRAFFCRA